MGFIPRGLPPLGVGPVDNNFCSPYKAITYASGGSPRPLAAGWYIKQRQSVIYRQTFVKDMVTVRCKLFDDSKVASVAFAPGFGFLGRFAA